LLSTWETCKNGIKFSEWLLWRSNSQLSWKFMFQREIFMHRDLRESEKFLGGFGTFSDTNVARNGEYAK
jgi:hypothetical protein